MNPGAAPAAHVGRKPTAPKKDPTAYQRLVDAWCAAWERQMGTKYVWNGIDGKAAARLVGRVPVDEIIARIPRWWSHDFVTRLGNTGFRFFESRYNDLGAKGPGEPRVLAGDGKPGGGLQPWIMRNP